jgi:small basic protein (TIGR04137 family)
MSLDKSLRSRASLARHRNVLNRAERIDVLKADDRWEAGRGPFGLPKVSHRKAKVGKKGAEKPTGEAAAGAEAAKPGEEAKKGDAAKKPEGKKPDAKKPEAKKDDKKK